MRKTKLSFDLFARQHGNDGLFVRFYRHSGSAILLQKQVSKASIAKIVGVSLHHIPLKDIFTPIWAEPSLTEYFPIFRVVGGDLIPLIGPISADQ